MISVEKPGTPEELMHVGTKGMKWGVRKNQVVDTTVSRGLGITTTGSRARAAAKTSIPLVGMGPDKIVRKTKSGETLTLTKDPPNFIIKGLAKLSKSYAENYRNGASISIHGSDGKTIGHASLWTKGKDDLYLNWISIDKSARGNGYATASVKAAHDWGKKAGKKRMILEVPGNAPDAHHIYEKMGFVKTRDLGNKNDIWGGLTEMEYKFK